MTGLLALPSDLQLRILSLLPFRQRSDTGTAERASPHLQLLPRWRRRRFDTMRTSFACRMQLPEVCQGWAQLAAGDSRLWASATIATVTFPEPRLDYFKVRLRVEALIAFSSPIADDLDVCATCRSSDGCRLMALASRNYSLSTSEIARPSLPACLHNFQTDVSIPVQMAKPFHEEWPAVMSTAFEQVADAVYRPEYRRRPTFREYPGSSQLSYTAAIIGGCYRQRQHPDFAATYWPSKADAADQPIPAVLA